MLFIDDGEWNGEEHISTEICYEKQSLKVFSSISAIYKSKLEKANRALLHVSLFFTFLVNLTQTIFLEGLFLSLGLVLRVKLFIST